MKMTPDPTRVPAFTPATTSYRDRFSGAAPFTNGVQGTSVSGVRSPFGDQIKHLPCMQNVVGITQGNAQGPAARGRPV